MFNTFPLLLMIIIKYKNNKILLAVKTNWTQPLMGAPSDGLMLSLSEEFTGFIRRQCYSCKVGYQQHCGLRTTHKHSSSPSCLNISVFAWAESVKYVHVLSWKTCCYSEFFFFFSGNGGLVQCHQGSQVPLPTGGLPRGQWRGGEEDTGAVVELVVGETRDGSVETVMPSRFRLWASVHFWQLF